MFKPIYGFGQFMLYSISIMKNLLLRKAKDIKGKAALEELRRAHFVIALLSAAFAFTLMFVTIYPVQLDTLLVSIATAFLLIIAAVSISIAFAIKR